MTTFRTQINGQSFEIRVDRGLTVEIDEDGITVMRRDGAKVSSGNVIPFVRPDKNTGTDDGPSGRY